MKPSAFRGEAAAAAAAVVASDGEGIESRTGHVDGGEAEKLGLGDLALAQHVLRDDRLQRLRSKGDYYVITM